MAVFFNKFQLYYVGAYIGLHFSVLAPTVILMLVCPFYTAKEPFDVTA
jgi:hypothetical protein